jgi:proteasome lid subunit RPN8/RPN11
MLALGKRLVEVMKEHAGRTYPEECCGVLLGKTKGNLKIVLDAMEIDNSSQQQRTRRFIITPENYHTAEIEATGKVMDILGFYHSHPDHPARPSQFDLDHAFPSWSYVIIAVEKGKPAAMTSWVLLDDRSGFEEEMFETVKSSKNFVSNERRGYEY